jgi:hypothetical protein
MVLLLYATGRLTLEAEFAAAGNAVIAADEDRMYAMDAGVLVQARLRSGVPVWEHEGLGWSWGALLTADDAALYRGGNAWSREDGALLWGPGFDDHRVMIPAGAVLLARDFENLAVYASPGDR